MAGTTRRKFTAEFKAEVAVAALMGDKTVAEIAQTYGIHPTMVTPCKGRLEKEGAQVFEGAERNAGPPVDVDALYQKLGQIGMERGLLASRPGIISALQRGRR
ncbi:MAG: transposase [Candidatus Dormibacteraeota bacterium]|nr:transposase [Candidatus Dormibacteraeota bacterium]